MPSHLADCLKSRCPVIAASDYVVAYPQLISAYVRHPFTALGTDGFGRSDYRKRLRNHFEVDRHWVALAALKSLTEDGSVPASTVTKAIKKFEIDPEKPNPVNV